MTLEKQILNQLKKLNANTENVVSKKLFEEKYYGKMTNEEWRHFKETFPDCVKRKVGTNSYLINVTMWKNQHTNEAA